MRLAVLSDIHGNLTALDAALADLEAAGGADVTWFLGDYAAFGPRPAECVRRVKAMFDAVKDDEAKRHTVRAIRGNTDRHLIYGVRPKQAGADDADAYAKVQASIRDFDARFEWGLEQLSFDDYTFLRKLPGECDLDVPGYGAVIGYHAIPGDDEGTGITPEMSDEAAADALLDREGRLGIGGHIHVQFDRTLSVGGWRAVNVGSIGISKDMPGSAQYGIFTFDGGSVQVDLRAVPYDVDAVIADLRAQNSPAAEWLAASLVPQPKSNS